VITIANVVIAPQDLIFADNDGVVVIPAKFEERIMEALIEKMNMENKVAEEIAKYASAIDIINQVGAF
jgi:regulator of RNase E activity RraA